MSKLGQSAIDHSMKSKRASERRDCDHCVSVIDGKTYPVKNWSKGGLQIFGDSTTFAVNDEVSVTLKFKLRGAIVDVPHKARVVRKTQDRVSFQFRPITRQMQKIFQSVVDDYVTTRFAESQLA
jgi:hypothetical protein